MMKLIQQWVKAKALKVYADKIITLAKKGDLHARRQAAALLYDLSTGSLIVLNVRNHIPTMK